MLKLKCCFCGECWNPKVSVPRACPICKRYFVGGRLPEEVDG